MLALCCQCDIFCHDRGRPEAEPRRQRRAGRTDEPPSFKDYKVSYVIFNVYLEHTSTLAAIY